MGVTKGTRREYREWYELFLDPIDISNRDSGTGTIESSNDLQELISEALDLMMDNPDNYRNGRLKIDKWRQIGDGIPEPTHANTVEDMLISIAYGVPPRLKLLENSDHQKDTFIEDTV